MGLAGLWCVARDALGWMPALVAQLPIPGVSFGIYNSPQMLSVGFLVGGFAVAFWFLGALVGNFGIIVGGPAAGLCDVATAQGIVSSLGMGLMMGSGAGVVIKDIALPFGLIGFLIFTFIVIVGSSNAVNLTDGLDGLAILPSVLVGSALGIFAYVVGRPDFSSYLLFPYIPGAGELVVICGALAGAGLAFLWFNAHPAQVFMGDVGALALGGCLGTVAVITRQEIVLAIMGGIFVVETLSVMIQTVYFRLSHGKRVFLMAPIHHHFELKGWKETQVVTRFWIITFILVLIGLSTLKIR